MATKKPVKETKAPREFKRSGESFTPIEPGEEIRGTFVRMRNVTITDKNNGQRKTIKAYDLKLEDGSMASISSRALLDDAFQDVYDALTYEKLIGMEIAIVRGEDVETSTTAETGNMMGTYSVLVY